MEMFIVYKVGCGTSSFYVVYTLLWIADLFLLVLLGTRWSHNMNMILLYGWTINIMFKEPNYTM